MNVQVLTVFVLFVTAMIWEAGMLDLSIENVANVAVIRCSGRIVRSSAAYQLRNAVASELDSRAIVLDISEVEEVERSEEHTSELQSRGHLVCRLLLEKKKKKKNNIKVEHQKSDRYHSEL